MCIPVIRAVFAASVALVSTTAISGGMDVCQAKRLGSRMVGERVSFQGRILSDGMHSTLVLPDKCPDVGYPMVPDEADGSPASVIRRSVMVVGAPGTTDKQITVDVDASIVMLRDGRVGLRILRVKRLVLVYTDGG